MKPLRAHPVPGATEIKHEARRRLLIGVTGLMLMLLLVLLAGLVTGRARQEAEIYKAQAQAAGVVNPGGDAANPGEPLADLGVAPSNPVAADKSQPPALAPDGMATKGVVVPDLQPDPALKRSQPGTQR